MENAQNANLHVGFCKRTRVARHGAWRGGPLPGRFRVIFAIKATCKTQWVLRHVKNQIFQKLSWMNRRFVGAILQNANPHVGFSKRTIENARNANPHVGFCKRTRVARKSVWILQEFRILHLCLYGFCKSFAFFSSVIQKWLVKGGTLARPLSGHFCN